MDEKWFRYFKTFEAISACIYLIFFLEFVLFLASSITKENINFLITCHIYLVLALVFLRLYDEKISREAESLYDYTQPPKDFL